VGKKWKGCLSTHGICGFAYGTYVDRKGNIVCGSCGEKIGTVEKNNYGKKLPEWIPREGYK